MSRNEGEVAPVETARAKKRTPRSIRFHDPEWERIEAFAEDRGLDTAEFVRFAALGDDAAASQDGGARERLAPLIERTFRYAWMVATSMCGDMLAAGRGEELEALIADARALQDDLVEEASAEGSVEERGGTSA